VFRSTAKYCILAAPFGHGNSQPLICPAAPPTLLRFSSEPARKLF
jgi:hypothetical protein